MKNNLDIIKDALILFCITIVLGLCLSFTKMITDEPIRQTKQKALLSSYTEVLNNYSSSDDITRRVIDNDFNSRASLISCMKVYDESKNDIGYIIITKINGYNGVIEVLTGFDLSGNITGIEYPSSLSETPGIGMKVTSDDFKTSFINKNSTDVRNVDTISGATISSTAVKEAVSLATDYVQVAIELN